MLPVVRQRSQCRSRLRHDRSRPPPTLNSQGCCRISQLALVGCPTAVTNFIGMRVQRIPACSQVLPLATDFALAAHVRSIKTITRKASLQTLAASHSTCSYKTPMRPWALHTSIRVHGNFRARSVRQQAVCNHVAALQKRRWQLRLCRLNSIHNPSHATWSDMWVHQSS